MGAWSANTFGNDSACDWAGEFLERPGLAHVEETLDRVLGGTHSLDSDDASAALAACEVIARLSGRYGVRDSYSAKIDEWVNANSQSVPDELFEKALLAIDRITGKKSELSSLWEGSLEWEKSVADLRFRVSG